MPLLDARVGSAQPVVDAADGWLAPPAIPSVKPERPSITRLSTASLISSRLRARLQTRRATRLRPTMSTAGEQHSVLPGGFKGVVGGRGTPSFGRASAARQVHGWSTKPGPRLTRQQREWVSCGGALTAHLSAYGRVTVRVISESVAVPWRDEYGAMRTSSAYPASFAGWRPQCALPLVWSRDVAISIDDTDCVLAHSVTPLRASHGPWQAMRRLRTRPLAELLYDDSRVRRSLLVSRYLSASARRDPLRGLLKNAGHALPRGGLVARRSVFERHGTPLLITECFLPGFWQMLDRCKALEKRGC